MSTKKQKMLDEILQKIQDDEISILTGKSTSFRKQRSDKAKRDLSAWILGHKKDAPHGSKCECVACYNSDAVNDALEQLAKEAKGE